MSGPMRRTVRPDFFAVQQRRIEAIVGAGGDVIRLDVGSPDLPPPPGVADVLARRAARSDTHGYQSHRGTEDYRRAWAECYRRDHGVHLDPERDVVGLLGTKEGIFHLPHAVASPGDVVLVPDPGYATYSRGAESAGAEVVAMPLLRNAGWLPDLDGLSERVLERTRLMWLNYPNNPTGASASLGLFRRAVEQAERYGFLVAHDATYLQVCWATRTPSLLQVPGASDVGVEFASLSKAYHMAGWRVGAAVGQRAALEALHARKTQADSGHFRPILDAAVQALATPHSWIEERNRVFHGRAVRLAAGLRGLGLDCETPGAGMYVWSRNPAGWESRGFAAAVLDHANVAIAPGTAFGDRGEGWSRWGIGVPEPRLSEALDRLEAALGCEMRLPRRRSDSPGTEGMESG